MAPHPRDPRDPRAALVAAVPRGAFTGTPANCSKTDVAHWTPDEDHLILEMVAVCGRRWQAIASHLPRRTDNGVRNRFARLVRGARATADPVGRYVCKRCGQLKRGHSCSARKSVGVGVQSPWGDLVLGALWQELHDRFC